MSLVALVLLFITAVLAGLVCFAICTRIDDRRWKRELGEYAGFFLDAGLDDAVAWWADQM
jgi:hypothetical protein